MFSKKIDFTDSIQYKLGERFDDLKESDYKTANDLVKLFDAKNKESKWKNLHFLNLYYFMKDGLESITGSKLHSYSNLNDILNADQKIEFEILIKSKGIEPISKSRPSGIRSILFLLPAILILAPLLLSTYFITAKDFSGWLYLSALFGAIITFGFIFITKGLKKQFSPNTLLDYAKSTFVVRYKTLSQHKHSTQQLENFILDELNIEFDKSFEINSIIPDN